MNDQKYLFTSTLLTSRCLKPLSLPYAISLSSSFKKLYYSSTVLASAALFNWC